MIVHMCKLRIVALDEQFETLIGALQKLGYLHLEPVSLDLPRRAGSLHRMQLTVEDEQRRQTLAEARSWLDELRTLLGEFPRSSLGDRQAWEKQSPEAIRDAADELLRNVRSLRRRRHNLEQDRRVLQRYVQVGGLVPRIGQVEDATEVLMFVFPSDERLIGRTLRNRLREMEPQQPRLRLFRVAGRNTIAAVVCRSEDAASVRDLAWRAGTLEFKLPLAYRGHRLAESFRRVHADLDSMPRQIAELGSELDSLRHEAGRWAAALEEVCAEETQRLDARHNFIEGTLLRVLHAFLPIDKKQEVIRVAAEATGGRFEVEELSLGPRMEEVPVVLRNPAFAKPFEVLLKLFPPPTYGTLDPTVINAIGVPVFFGLIVGDVGYGFVILMLAGLLWWFGRRDVLRASATIAAYCAVSTIAFGILYGEVFGSLGAWLGMHPLINREDPSQLAFLLKIAVCIGAMHVGLGLSLGVVTARQVLDQHVLYERVGQLLCLCGAVFFALGLFAGSYWFVLAVACFVIGVAVLICGAGVVGLLEVFSLMSNILSYSRLMALGVASVVLAMVANRIFAKLDYGLAGLLAAMMLHVLNVGIAMFSPTIHTLRLHYVEFFTKFYRPEGRGYVPFGSRPDAVP